MTYGRHWGHWASMIKTPRVMNKSPLTDEYGNLKIIVGPYKAPVEGFRLEVGMIIQSSCSNEKYRIISIRRECECPLYHHEVNMKNPPSQPKHVHMRLSDLSGKDRGFYINHIIESTLKRCDIESDYLVIIKNSDDIQTTLF